VMTPGPILLRNCRNREAGGAGGGGCAVTQVLRAENRGWTLINAEIPDA
jgi:hypothetical protein